MSLRIGFCAVLAAVSLTVFGADEKTADQPDEEKLKQNEGSALRACKTYAEAQEIYRRTDWDQDGVLEYAQAFTGDNSLYEKKAGQGNLTLVDEKLAKAGIALRMVPLEPKDIPEPTADETKAFETAFAHLGSDEYSERETGSAELSKIGAGAIKLIEKVSADLKDPEVLQRCQAALRTLKEQLAVKIGKKAMIGTPMYGYLFKVLTAQGAGTPGGKRSYLVKDNMTLGYALIAFPAEYGKSGRKSFLINNMGTVYEKDLGADSRTKGEETTEYDPKGWNVSE